jgi:prephenate dehydrogenase
LEIKSVSIIGLGLIGGSIAKSLKVSKLSLNISAFDHDEVLTAAINEKVIDRKLSSVEEALDSELIFLCLPLDSSIEIFKTIAPRLTERNLVTDVCGVKSIFHNEWKECGSKGFYAGGHPMTGKEKGGFENSDSLLFENSIYILTNEAKDFFGWTDFIDILHSLGARVALLTPKVHDMVVASVSHLPQLVAVSLINSANIKESDINFYDYAAGGFRDMTRIASSAFDIWEPVVKQNKDKILSALTSFEEELHEVRKLISEDKLNLLAGKFESARIKRDEIPKNTKGMLSQLYDIFVYVKDQPGEISKISTALFENSINIKDMELLKIREGMGGTFRLAFSTQAEAQKAKEILEVVGFSTKG